MPLLNVALVPGPSQVVVRLTGETDLSTAPQLTDALEQAAGLGTRHVVVDVGCVRFWDCSGLHALVDLTQQLARAGRQLRIAGAPAATRRLVVLAGFTDLLELDGRIDVPGVRSGVGRVGHRPTLPSTGDPDRAPAGRRSATWLRASSAVAVLAGRLR